MEATPKEQTKEQPKPQPQLIVSIGPHVRTEENLSLIHI